jgi:hypothetical protein
MAASLSAAEVCRSGLQPLGFVRLGYVPRMFTLVILLFGSLGTALRSRAALPEILALRHQLGVLKRSSPARLPFTCWDRAFWAFLLRHWSGWKDSLVLVKPETVIGWHRRAFRLF